MIKGINLLNAVLTNSNVWLAGILKSRVLGKKVKDNRVTSIRVLRRDASTKMQ